MMNESNSMKLLLYIDAFLLDSDEQYTQFKGKRSIT